MGRKKGAAGSSRGNPAQHHAGASCAQVHQDWENREFVESVQLNILRITQFLNEFDNTVRYRLAKMNGRIATLKRTLERVEFSLQQAKHSAA